MKFESLEDYSNFIYPNLDSAIGEIERVAVEFTDEDPSVFTQEFIARAQHAKLMPLDENIWKMLENTDSLDIEFGDWKRVEYHAVEGHLDTPRDWKDLKEKMEQGRELDAPIVCQKGGKLHLVSGNTRLMVARAIGITPQVLLVNMD